MNKNSCIYVAGHTGMVGSAIIRQLEKSEYTNIIRKSHSDLDLTNQADVNDFIDDTRPEYMFIAAAKAGGIKANAENPADFFYINSMIAINLLNAAYIYRVKKVLYLGSSCIYPRLASQPINEEQLLAGYLEKTNEAYAIAKIAGLKMAAYYREQFNCDFITAMPTNLFGYNDNFDLNTGHFIPNLIRKFHEAKISNQPNVTVWGTGNAFREVMFADDLANACIFLIENYSGSSHINVGTGRDYKISYYAELIRNIVGYNGNIIYDSNFPDGTPRKLLNIRKLIALGWESKTSLEDGLKLTYEWYLANQL